MKKQIISTPNAPAAIGPYSQAVKAGNLLFVSGQIPLDPATGTVVEGDVTVQAKQVFENVKAILTEAGATFEDVVKTTVFLKDMNDFAAMNAVYASYYTENCPARSAVEVGRREGFFKEFNLEAVHLFLAVWTWNIHADNTDDSTT